MTVLDLISEAMRAIVALGAGELPSAEESASGLLHLNAQLGGWSADGDMIFTRRRDVLDLVVGTQTYTIGTGGAFNVPRPVALTGANFIHTATGLRSPIKIVGQTEWDKETEQNISAIQPKLLYDDFAFPLSTIFLLPKPFAAGQLELYSWAELAAFATIADPVSFPPGYDEALIYGLAVRIAPGLVGKLDPNIVNMAKESRDRLRVLNRGPLPGTVQQQAA